MAEYQHVTHSFEPVYNEHSTILILGSFPSVKSREQGFYYGYPRNRFWRVLSCILQEPLPQTINEKKDMLLKHRIAVYDVIESCDIIGSSDSSIRGAVPADIRRIVDESAVQIVFTNGKTAGGLYRRYHQPDIGLPMVELPSTSPANAACSEERLVEIWGGELRKYITG
ncbi:MAG: DNA-deoxyinosine glycosylase [Lachnospiraceae bacterium]|nr:DNA-deoxyinosine glycosylase [Lachnospiraceae bacterium]